MGRALISAAASPLKLRRFFSVTQSSPRHAHQGIAPSLRKNVRFSARPARFLQTRAVLSDFPNTRKYPRVGAESTGPVPAAELLGIVELAAKIGAGVVMDAVNKPRNISYKGVTDLVTDTDKMSESVILDVVRKNFKDHLILGEEGGLIGDAASDYLWCIDPLDGFTKYCFHRPAGTWR